MSNKGELIRFILGLTDEEANLILTHWDEMSHLEVEPVTKHPYYRAIYSIKCNSNGKEYIGRTKNFEKRIKEHLSLLKHGNHGVEDLQKDFDRYGNDFTFSILEEINAFKDNKREYEWMEIRKTYLRESGYNYNDTTFRRWRSKKQRESNES